jgi:hypothetical protein
MYALNNTPAYPFMYLEFIPLFYVSNKFLWSFAYINKLFQIAKSKLYDVQDRK